MPEFALSRTAGGAPAFVAGAVGATPLRLSAFPESSRGLEEPDELLTAGRVRFAVLLRAAHPQKKERHNAQSVQSKDVLEVRCWKPLRLLAEVTTG